MYQGASARVPVYLGRKAWNAATMPVRKSGTPRPKEEEILMLELSELMAGALSLLSVQTRSRASAEIQKRAESKVERAARCVANISLGHGKSRRSCTNKRRKIIAKKPERGQNVNVKKHIL